jgi:hypothetical protein
MPLLQTSNAEVSDIIERAGRESSLERAPVHGPLAFKRRRVKPPPGTGRSAVQQAGNVVIIASSQRTRLNIYMLDRVKVTDSTSTTWSLAHPSMIQEFKIQKSQYPAEFGGKACL